MPRPMILTFNLSDARLAKLRFLCMKLGAASKGKESESTQPMQKLMFKLKKPQTQTPPPEPEETPMQKFFKSMAKRKDD